ncbi:dynein axonemal intermediate chain 7-like [Arctopsyche grandis]|uniref:dynein axonemal intermediate chain 7-like n=1 Tax=Arctopsyche grandis TaxID=121162 RepID=UPI00406DA131
MGKNHVYTTVEEDEKLTEVKFREIYNPPPTPAPGTVRTPEEIEADIRRQEAALERLFLITIQLPDTVLWIEPPIVCCWNTDKNYWTTDDIHDLKYNEDKFTVNFRTGQLRPIAFATSKYSNLPYQGWELKPNDDQLVFEPCFKPADTGVIVTIMGAIIVCEFEVLEVGIKLKSLQNGATKALQDMVDETFTLNELTGRLQAGGVDFFPSEDAPNLIEGSCLKHWTMESHLYHCMAHLCTAYNFTWSRWNVTADRRTIVQQMREYLQQHSESFEILHVTPLQAILVTATEVSAEYSTQPIEGLQFYPDLYSLIKGHGNAEVLEVVSSVPWRLVENVKDLLCAIKPCSYS